ncbi:hypothetical protein BDP27DRAFT_1295500 [Rhodocollybia butyracea]|uniref:Annexin n=1 Tax=Rhodocollybia butyracea TaxID=206335 RepID=A0A9P5PLY4_9AGAR|nr:hypothetical protein BDP27DRAFT_1295500 [Rhodocollybia butyracea]
MKLGEKANQMFKMILSANPPPENAPVDSLQVENDVAALYKACPGKQARVDEVAFFEIIINRSRTHLDALCKAYRKKYQSLTKVIKSDDFPAGHIKQAMLFIINGAKSKHAMEAGVWRDAKMLEASMVGFGTKDTQLVRRIVRYHWDAPRFEAIKLAYKTKYSKKNEPTSLEERVRGETSQNYGAALLAIVKGV